MTANGRCPECKNWHPTLDAPTGCWRYEVQRLRQWWRGDPYGYASPSRKSPRYRRSLLKALRRGWRDGRANPRGAYSPYRQTNFQAWLDGAWGFGLRLARIYPAKVTVGAEQVAS